MTKEEVELAFSGLPPYYAYKQGLQDGMAYNEESFRREAAKDILAGLCANTESFGQCTNLPAFAIDLADELIKQLREDEK